MRCPLLARVASKEKPMSPTRMRVSLFSAAILSLFILVACESAMPSDPTPEEGLALEEAALSSNEALPYGTSEVTRGASTSQPDGYCDNTKHLATYKKSAVPPLRIAVHVVRSGTKKSLAPSSVPALLSKAEAFLPSGFALDLAGPVDVVNVPWAWNLSLADFDALVETHDAIDAIDVWIVHGFAGLCGRATSIGPNDGFYTGNDALVMVAKCGAPTLAHELGHLLGLFHTHHTAAAKSCSSSGDRCCDTPSDPGPSTAFPEGAGTCGPAFAPACLTQCSGGAKPDPGNVMSYYACKDSPGKGHFSACQRARMACHIARHYGYATVAAGGA